MLAYAAKEGSCFCDGVVAGTLVVEIFQYQVQDAVTMKGIYFADML